MSVADRQLAVRSRIGCTECRFHKKKCDESRPICGRCGRLGKPCVFQRAPGARVGNKRRAIEEKRGNDSPQNDDPDDFTAFIRSLLCEPTATAAGTEAILEQSLPEQTASGSASTSHAEITTYPIETVAVASYDSLESDGVVVSPEPYLAMLPAPRPPPFAYAITQSQYQLVHHWFNVASQIGVAVHSSLNPLHNHLLTLASTSATPESNPAFHGLLAVSSLIFAGLRGNIFEPSEYRTKGQSAMVRALRLLSDTLADSVDNAGPDGSLVDSRQATAQSRMVCGTTALILLASGSSGDTRFVSLVKEACLGYIADRLHGTIDTSPETRVSLMLIGAYEILSGFTGHPPSSHREVLPSLLGDFPGVGSVDSVWGVSRRCWGSMTRALDLLRRLDRAQDDPAELLAVLADAAELEEELETVEHDVVDPALSEHANNRIITGTEILVIGLKVLLSRDVYKVPREDAGVQARVMEVQLLLSVIPQGNEVGLLLPLVIVGSNAIGQARPAFQSFIKRATWKGTAGPHRALQVLQDVWADKSGKTTWRQAVLTRGRPIFV